MRNKNLRNNWIVPCAIGVLGVKHKSEEKHKLMQDEANARETDL